MPCRDGSGPGGLGPRTGRGFGFCSGFSHPGNTPGRGFGRGGGRGFGRGFRAGFGFSMPDAFIQSPQYSPEEEKKYLENQISTMEKTVKELKKRVEEIDSSE